MKTTGALVYEGEKNKQKQKAYLVFIYAHIQQTTPQTTQVSLGRPQDACILLCTVSSFFFHPKRGEEEGVCSEQDRLNGRLLIRALVCSAVNDR